MHNHMQSISWFSFDLSNMKSVFSTKVNDFQVPRDMLISIEKPPGGKKQSSFLLDETNMKSNYLCLEHNL